MLALSGISEPNNTLDVISLLFKGPIGKSFDSGTVQREMHQFAKSVEMEKVELW